MTAPQCSPSRGSLYTGYYPHVNGLMGLAHTEWELNTDQTLPHQLSELGYETHLFGLQHISESPEGLGYDQIHTAGRLSPNVAPELHSVNRAADIVDTVLQYLDIGLESPFFASVGFLEAHRLETNEVDEGEGDILYGYGDSYDADDPDNIEVPGYLPDKPGIREDLAAMRGMVYEIDDTPDDVDGYSVVPLLDDDQTYASRDHVFAEITWHDTYAPMRAVRTERFKYVRSFWHNPRVFLPNDVYASLAGREVRGRYGRPSRVCEELCDLDFDPHEQENLAADETYEQVRTRLASTLATWMHETDDPILDGPVLPGDYDLMFDGLR